MKAYIKLVLLTAMAVVTFNPSAHAGLLLEPYLSYGSGQIKGVNSVNYSGTEYGARVGYTMMGFGIGGEYMATNLTTDSNPKDTLTSGDLGVFVSYKFPVLVRAYATYFPSSSLKDDNGTFNQTFKSGNILKLGVGFTGIPFIQIGVEYITSTYSKVEIGGVDFNTSPNVTTSGYALSVSAPFNLF
jgi:hypothetical protein